MTRSGSMDKLKSVLYCRVSTKYEEQDQSYKAQMKFKGDQFDVTNIYGEKVSGRYLYKRIEQQRLLHDAGIDIEFVDREQPVFYLSDREPLFQCIIVANTSRFGRNLVEVKQIIEKLYKKNVVVYFDDIGKFSNASDISMTLDILFILDEQYSKTTQAKVLYGYERKRKEGYLSLHRSIFGMDYIVGENILVPNDDAETVEKIFKDYADGMGVRGIADKYDMKRHQITNIINNPRYCGLDCYGKRQETRCKPVEELELFESERITPIISQELWKECQKIKLSKMSKETRKGVKKGGYPLSGKIVCSHCGKSYVHHSRYSNWNYWRCSTRQDGEECLSPNINEKLVVEYLKEHLNSYVYNIESAINEVLEEYEYIQVDTLQEELEEANQNLNKLLDLYMDGMLDKEMYSERFEIMSDQKEDIKKRIENANDLNNYYVKVNMMKEKHMKRLANMNELIHEDYASVLNELESVEIGMKYKEDSDRIYPVVSKVIFKGLEEVRELTKHIQFGGITI